mmetsp:Transcript_40277/g.87817  ORF Transcript_40277/g.87817 Transcript_40277/m.87817 type:complete len:657 (+) Transcript_40277:260-2230(+)
MRGQVLLRRMLLLLLLQLRLRLLRLRLPGRRRPHLVAAATHVGAGRLGRTGRGQGRVLRVQRQRQQHAAAVAVERAEARVQAARFLGVRELLQVRLQPLESRLHHLQRLLLAAPAEELLVGPALRECRRVRGIREVDERVAHVVPLLLVPGAVEEVEVAPHRVGQVLEHRQQSPLGQVGGDVGDHESRCLHAAPRGGLVGRGAGAPAGPRLPVESGLMLRASPGLPLRASDARAPAGGRAASDVADAAAGGVATVPICLGAAPRSRGRSEVAAAAVAGARRRPRAGVVAPGNLGHAGATAAGRPRGPVGRLALVAVVALVGGNLAVGPRPLRVSSGSRRAHLLRALLAGGGLRRGGRRCGGGLPPPRLAAPRCLYLVDVRRGRRRGLALLLELLRGIAALPRELQKTLTRLGIGLLTPRLALGGLLALLLALLQAGRLVLRRAKLVRVLRHALAAVVARGARLRRQRGHGTTAGSSAILVLLRGLGLQEVVFGAGRRGIPRPQLLRRVGEAAAAAVLTAARLREAAHLHLEKAVRGPQLRLAVSEPARPIRARLSCDHGPAHAGSREVRLPPDLIERVRVGALDAVVAAAMHEELAQVRLEHLERVFVAETRVASAPSHSSRARECALGHKPFSVKRAPLSANPGSLFDQSQQSVA